MSDRPIAPPPGWYPAKGDPPGTHRYWDGEGWQGEPRPVPGLAADDTFPLAGLPRRAGARLIDVVIWTVVGLVVGAGSLPSGGLAVIVLGLLIVAYEASMVGLRGGTAGKLVLGLAVANDDGSEATPVTGLRRALPLVALTVLSFVPFLWILTVVIVPLLALAGVLMIYADDRRQTPWDKVGRTLVVVR